MAKSKSNQQNAQLGIGDVMHRSIEFAKYANRYYELCYETEPCWFNKNNHERYTSNQVYNAFVKYLKNGA